MSTEVARKRILFIALLLTAVGLRVAALSLHSAHLTDDRDAYLAIASGVVEGRGFSDPGTTEPTAFRPPLYPLVLSLLIKLGGGKVLLAVFHLSLGVGTVFLTLLLAVRLKLGGAAYVAAFLVALDPLLVEYATFPMTETLFTFLVVLMLVVATPPLSAGDTGKKSSDGNGISQLKPGRRLALGAMFGLCALCRPTIWAFGGLAALFSIYSLRNNRQPRRRVAMALGQVALAAVVVVSPWLIRNLIVLGRPILTTTHGGYTLLLGNNPVFYREVVEKPWGTVWADAPADRTQKAWYRNVQSSMTGELGADADQSSRDEWMYRRARQNIRDEPALFLRSCMLRFLRFWNIAPMGPAGSGLSWPVLWGVRLFYSLVLLAMVGGLFRVWLRRGKSGGWRPLVLLIVAFSGVHLVYWTNMRMRAPLTPAIAVLAAALLDGRRRKADNPRAG